MKRKVLSMLLVFALAVSMLAGCGKETKTGENGGKGLENTGDEGQEEKVELSELTFGKNGWKIDTSYDYSESQYKRYDGLEFTRIVNTLGFEVPEGMTVDDNDRVWSFELKTGLKPKTLWSANGDAYTQKQNAAIASGEIPDLMMVDINQYYSLVKSGLIADLTDELLEGNHPGIQSLYEMGNNVALETIKVDGRIYGIPKVYTNFDSSPLVWIRKDWMEELGLETPKTYADLEAIAKAFMKKDFDGNGKADTYGIPVLASFSASYGGSGNLCDVFLNVGGAAPGIWQKEDGTVIYGSLMEGAKDALTLLNDWYQKGIIPSDFATWDSETLKQILGEDKAGIVFSPWWGCWDVLSASINLNENAQWTAYMLPEEEGGEIRSAAGNPVNGIYVVRKDFEDPSAFVYAYDMLVNGYKPDMSSGYSESFETNNAYVPMQASTPPSTLTSPLKDVLEKVFDTHELTTEEEIANYVKQETDGIMNGTESQFTLMFTYGVPVVEAIEAGENPRKVTVGEDDAITTYCNYVACTVGFGAVAYAEPTGVSTLFQGTTDSMIKYGSFLETFENEAYTKMIMGDTGGKSISDYFDTFVQEYLKQGGAVITEEVREMIDK